MSEPQPPSRPATRSDGSDAGDADNDIDEVILATMSDYLDGALTGAERAEVERKIADDPTWKRAHGEMTETRKFLSGMRRAHAPATFVEGVAETIHQRSAGRFFGRRTFGDRVPFGVLVAIALAGILMLGYVLWSSSTGSLKVDREHPTPSTSSGGPAVAPP
jgi:anti-sigma factor RsiW